MINTEKLNELQAEPACERGFLVNTHLGLISLWAAILALCVSASISYASRRVNSPFS